MRGRQRSRERFARDSGLPEQAAAWSTGGGRLGPALVRKQAISLSGLDMATQREPDAVDRDTARHFPGDRTLQLEETLGRQGEEIERLRSALQASEAQVAHGDQRAAALEASRAELVAQLKDWERRVNDAIGSASPRARRRILEARDALAEARSRAEREHVMRTELEAEVAGLRARHRAMEEDAERRLAEVRERTQRVVVQTRVGAQRSAARVQARMDEAVAEARREICRELEVVKKQEEELRLAWQEARAALDEARTRLGRERARRGDAEVALAAVRYASAAASKAAGESRREVKALRAEAESLRGERPS